MTRGGRQHRHDRSLAAGAALGDLGRHEQARWAGQCAECRKLETELEGVLAALALAAPARVPPPSLLAGVRAAIHAEADRA